MAAGTPGKRPTFAADAMLGRLAKLLRMLGCDVFYDSGIDDPELKLLAVREGRIVLTRDREIADTNLPIEVVLVESDLPDEQLREVVERFSLDVEGALFTRCLLCNTLVEDVRREDVEERVPPYVYATQERFVRCPSCGRIYWAATHVAGAKRRLQGLFGVGGEGLDGE
jgi:uncharacterized protein with PIN domain